jgi:hypothetical protein
VLLRFEYWELTDEGCLGAVNLLLDSNTGDYWATELGGWFEPIFSVAVG